MSTLWEKYEKNEVKVNDVIASFIATLNKQIVAFHAGDENKRSWVKKEGDAFRVKLGKLEHVHLFPTKDDVQKFLADVLVFVTKDESLKAEIEAAYGEKEESEGKTRRKRRTKAEMEAARAESGRTE